MNSFSIFRHRLLRNWRYQFNTFRQIADWTIWLYLIIPANVISIFIYRSWWIEGAPQWIQWMPLELIFIVGYFFTWTGTYRSYMEEADKVFLVKKKKLFYGLKKWGFQYSLLFQAMSTFVIIVLFLPFLIEHYQLTWTHVGTYFLFLLSMKYLIMYVKFHMKKIERKTIRIIAMIGAFIVVSWFVQLVASFWMNDLFFVFFLAIMIGLTSILLYFPLLKKNSVMDVELLIESEEKQKLVNMVFQISYDLEKTKVITRKRPWLFRKSRRIFRRRTATNGFIELFAKVFIRNSSHLLTYFQICSVTAAAVLIIPPLWIKCVILGGFLLMMWSWLVGVWERIVLSHPFTKKYQEHDAYFSAKKRTIAVLFVLSILIVGMLFSIGSFFYHHFLNVS
ncbi:ABC transporter permease [Robertmurraya massiliosenegalensis]|uniref:ABC transporter permease n=1 Tax=Robertmurraya TaxID=2837507 RepID=UPI0039A4D7AC